MPTKILFHLRNVPEDEAEEVRALLQQEAIPYYETSAGILGISLPALWLRDEADFTRARHLLDDYQRARAQRMRAAYEAARQRGEAPGLWDSFAAEPFRFVGYMVLIGVVLYLSLSLFL